MTMRVHIFTTSLLVSTCLISRPAMAQSGSACRPTDKYASHLQSELISMATAARADSSVRAAFHLPLVTASDVQIVSDSATCASAAAAYDREMVRLFNETSRSRTVHVVRVGTSGYAIMDPSEQAGEWIPVVFVDTSFAYVSNWGG